MIATKPTTNGATTRKRDGTPRKTEQFDAWELLDGRWTVIKVPWPVDMEPDDFIAFEGYYQHVAFTIGDPDSGRVSLEVHTAFNEQFYPWLTLLTIGHQVEFCYIRTPGDLLDLVARAKAAA